MRLFSRGHPALDEVQSTLFHALDVDVHAHDPYPTVGPTNIAPGGFFRGLYDMSLLPLYVHHTYRHVW